MFNSDMLEVAIGLIFVYLLFSFATTALREGLEAWLKHRGALLETGILGLFTEPVGVPSSSLAAKPAIQPVETDDHATQRAEAILESLYRSAPVYGLYRGDYVPPSARTPSLSGRTLPSYIPSRTFADGLLSVVLGYAKPGAGGTPGSLDRLRLALEGVPNAQIRDVVRAGIKFSGGDPERLRQHIEAWYDAAMDRVAGQYRRRTHVIVLVTSLLMAVALNINTVTIVEQLSQNAALRAAIQKQVVQVTTEKSYATAEARLPAQLDSVQGLGLPIGWDAAGRVRIAKMAREGPDLDKTHFLPLGWLLAVLGWLMTALAISLGAPFWFDILNKVMIVRSTVKPNEKSGEERSKDPAPAGTGGSGTDAAGADAAAIASAGSPANTAPPAAPPPGPLSAISETDRQEFGALDPNERPREEED
jgi:hypothetical protein